MRLIRDASSGSSPEETAAEESERWIRWRNRGLLLALATPLVAFPWSYDATDLPKLTFLRLLALGMILVGLFTRSRSAWASSNEAIISKIHPLRSPLLFFLILTGASALRSLDPWLSLVSLTDWVLLAFFVFAFTGAAKSIGFQIRALLMLMGVGGACAAWAICQRFLPDPLNGAMLHRFAGSFVGPFASPVTLAGFMASVYPLAHWSLYRFGERRYSIKIAAILIALALIFSEQRVALIAGAVGCIAMLASLKSSEIKRSQRMTRFLIPALFLLIAFVSKSSSYSTYYLQELNRISLEMTKANPLLGWGPGAYGIIAPRYALREEAVRYIPNLPPYPSAHNEYFSILTSSGILGFTAFLIVIGLTFVILAKRLSARDGSVDERTVDASPVPQAGNRHRFDTDLAAAWIGFLVAWLIQGWRSPQSIAMQFPFWCVIGMASTPAITEEGRIQNSLWPKPIRWIGAIAVLILVSPLPHVYWRLAFKNGFHPASALSNELTPGFGAATRWMIGDIYYASAIKERERGDWDASMTDHLNALAWAPTRMGNWLGFGETALMATDKAKHRPSDWYQFGQIAYSRAEKMEPENGFLYYGEARLLTSAVSHGGAVNAPLAEKDYRKALTLYPNLASIHFDYGTLLENIHRAQDALLEYETADRLSPGNSLTRMRILRLSSQLKSP